MQDFQLHFISFKDAEGKSYNIAYGSGANVAPWHLDKLEAWLIKMRTNPPTEEEIRNYHRKETRKETKPPKGRSPSKKSIDFDILDLFT